MTAIRYTPTAQRQLDEIWAYSMAHWGEARTNRYLMAIEEAIEAVASGRRRARPCADLWPRLKFVRSGSHNIYLRLDAAGDVLQVMAVLHQRMEPSRHLKDE
jgi:toxin ParE1/3/4